jgi:hypothetical protein
MPFYEYKVVPAPEKAPKVRGLKGPAKFAHALETLMNGLAQDGWEYVRAETLPDEERRGLTGRVEVVRNVLVFRRELYFEDARDTGSPEVAEAPAEPRGAVVADHAAAPSRGWAAEAPQDASRDAPQDETAGAQDETAGAQDVGGPRFSRRPLVADRWDTGAGD